MKIITKIIITFGLILSIFISSCGPKPAAKILSGNSTNAQFRSQGAAIDLKYSSPVLTTAGQSTVVDLEFIGKFHPGQRLEVTFTNDPSLEILSPLGLSEVDLSNPKLQVEVYAREAVIAYIHVICELFDANGNVSARVFSVPVQAGENSKRVLRKNGELEQDSTGEMIINMPAEVTIER